MKLSEIWSNWGGFLAQWMLSMTLGGGLAYGLAILIIETSAPTLEGEAFIRFIAQVAAPLGGGLAGLLVGAFQWYAMRPMMRISLGWIAATAVGWGVGTPLIIGISGWISSFRDDLNSTDALLVYILGAALAGLIAGAAQWVILSQKMKRAGWWLVASAAGWTIAWVATLALAWGLRQQSRLPVTLDEWLLGVLLGCVAGTLVGLETGIALVGLWAQQLWEERHRETFIE